MISNVKSGIVFMAMMALSCSVAYADILWYQWYGLIENPLHIRPNNETVEGYGFNSLSSYATGEIDGKTGYITYYDWEPPLGSPGFSNRYIEVTVPAGGPARFTGDFSGALTGLMLTAKIARLTSPIGGTNVHLFHTPITNPRQLMIMNGRHPSPKWCEPTKIETWVYPPSLLYTAPVGFEINAISTASYGAYKVVGVSISSHGVPGSVMLLYQTDGDEFYFIGPITKEDGTPIVAWESFALFVAANPKRHFMDSLFIYYVESATSAGQLLWTDGDNWKSGRFFNVADMIPFNAGDAVLSGQLGTAAGVSRDGRRVLLLRHGSVICSTGEERTVMQKRYYPTMAQVTPEQPVLVQNTDGTIIPVDALSMPTLVSDQCFPTVTPGYQTALVWIDRVSLLLKQASANSFVTYD